jgi:hypothetical protein
VNAELSARRTAAAAVQADFGRASYEYAMQGGAVPDWATWAQRLSLSLASLLDDRTPAAAGPGGPTVLSAADATEVLGALEHAAAALAERAAQWCDDCARYPAGACEAHLDDLDQADAYRALAARLGGRTAGEPVPLADAMAGLRAEVVDAIDVALASTRAARQLGAIRGILAAFDWEYDDRQVALEHIERIAGGSEDQ